MGTTRCYYEVLNIERTASGDEVKRSYRRLAMKYHPDRNPGDTEAEAAFKEAAEAYEVLSDSERRAAYDRFGRDGRVPDQDMTSGRCTSRTSSRCSTTSSGKRRWRSRSRQAAVCSGIRSRDRGSDNASGRPRGCRDRGRLLPSRRVRYVRGFRCEAGHDAVQVHHMRWWWSG